MTFSKAAMAAGPISAHPPHLCAKGLQAGVVIAKAAGFHSAARGVVLWVKEQHKGAAAKPSQAANNAIVIFELNRRSLVANG
jgi:hypothetical protein